MKSTTFILFVIAGLCIGVNKSAQAQTVATANQLEIGPTGANQVSNTSTMYSGAIGSGNNVTAAGSFAVGFNNGIGVYSTTGNSSMCVGASNSNSGVYSTIFGSNNTIWNDNGEDGSAFYSLVSGNFNYNNASSYSAVFGYNNSVDIANYSLTVGAGLINTWSYSTLVGKYNAYQGGSGLLFIVGNGADSTHRSNALEVYNDGTVLISKAQGDILMGQFGN